MFIFGYLRRIKELKLEENSLVRELISLKEMITKQGGSGGK